MLIGTGVWLLILLIVLTFHYLKKIELPYGLGWWAFVFPTASVSIASLNHAVLVGQSFFAYCGLGVYLLLIAITLTVLSKTIKSFYSSSTQLLITKASLIGNGNRFIYWQKSQRLFPSNVSNKRQSEVELTERRRVRFEVLIQFWIDA